MSLWGRQPPKVLMFMHLLMDIELILPMLKAARDRADIVPFACVTEELLHHARGLSDRLNSWRINVISCSQNHISTGLEPSLRGILAIVSASESTANPHRPAHRLIERANASGVKTYTMQHGFENIGLTYFDHIHSVENIRFASQKIFVWGPVSELDARVPVETRIKCIPVGFPKESESVPLALERPGGRKFLISVFENLHWHRYASDYTEQFLLDLQHCAQGLPDVSFFIKPHPAGKWMTNRYKGPLPVGDNIIIADPGDARWFPYTGVALVAISDGTITTPSTIAIDAARACCPVAVVGYRMDLPKYQPLPVIRSSEDWISFVEGIRAPKPRAELLETVSCFLEKVVVPGNACAKMLDIIAADIRQQGSRFLKLPVTWPRRFERDRG